MTPIDSEGSAHMCMAAQIAPLHAQDGLWKGYAVATALTAGSAGMFSFPSISPCQRPVISPAAGCCHHDVPMDWICQYLA